MVSPVVLIAASLGFAFLYPLVERLGERAATRIALLVLAAFAGTTAGWTVSLIGSGVALTADTAGFVAPLSIQLQVTAVDALAMTVVTLLALAALVQLTERATDRWHGKQVVLFFVLLLGSYGLIMTRDLFNVFVFMEISGISVFGLLSTSRDGRVFEAGFKYMVASGLASVFFLIGTAFVYRSVGSLSIADITAAAPVALASPVGVMGLLFLVTGILIELKPAPANGWAIDTYQAADPGIGALLSAVNATAMVFVLVRVMPILAGASPVFVPLVLIAGAGAFLIPQAQALLQESFKRMLGYSSVAQIGLVVLAIVIPAAGVPFAGVALAVPLVLLLNHAVAKATLFWIADATGDDASGFGGSLPASLRGRPALLVVAAIAVLALLGLPPFPGFWAKWSLVMGLAAGGHIGLLVVVLLGSLLEVVYLGRWLIMRMRHVDDDATVVSQRIPADFAESRADAVSGAASGASDASGAAAGAIPVGATVSLGLATLLMAGASVAALLGSGVGMPVLIVLIGVAAFAVLDVLRIPLRLQAIVAIAGLSWWGVSAVSGAALTLQSGFVLLFVGGAVVQLVALLARPGRRAGLVALIVGMVLSLAALTAATSPLEVFVAWELMTLTSFFLVVRGRFAAAASVRYLTFSLASALLMLAAFSLATAANPAFGTGGGVIGTLTTSVPWAAVLLALSVLIKLGAIGLHIWLPSSYAEAEDEVSSLASSVLSKAGILLLFLGAGSFAAPLFAGVALNQVLGWIGVITALAGGMMALFQEDIKYTLAYSSMSQLGYMVLAFALMSHLGWVTALYLAVNHLLFKGMLFLAVAGIVMRTGTRLMYQMGGLIKRMPFSFVSVLVGIIAVSGVPPLAGFGGKWLLYTALIEQGWYLQAALALFSSGIAFLYLFRLIHSMFLGQRKTHHDTVTEAPAAVLIPQFVFLVIIIAISMFPNLLIKPLQTIVEPAFASSVRWEGYTVISSLGYWNGNAVMYVVIGVFLAPLLWLLAVKGRTYRVEQFNIVFAAERPHTPQSTHYAYNFYGHYQKAFGRLLDPWVERFWSGVSATAGTVSQTLRAWNTGNPQTYALQILLYLFLTYLVARGGL